MPWEGQLMIGKMVRSRDEAKEILAGLDPDHDWNKVNFKETKPFGFPRRVMHFKGIKKEVIIELLEEHEGGGLYDSNDYTDAMVGFKLTSRYHGAILDKDCEYGRGEPFEFDVDLLKEILDQVHEWWADAKAIIWTRFY